MFFAGLAALRENKKTIFLKEKFGGYQNNPIFAARSTKTVVH
jgi:hypothetical protein